MQVQLCLAFPLGDDHVPSSYLTMIVDKKKMKNFGFRHNSQILAAFADILQLIKQLFELTQTMFIDNLQI